MGVSMEVIGRAVQRVHDPEVSPVFRPRPLTPPAVLSSRVFLGQDPMIGVSLEDHRKGCLLSLQIHTAHEIAVGLPPCVIRSYLPKIDEMNSSGRFCSLKGGGEKWIHRVLPLPEGSGAQERAVT